MSPSSLDLVSVAGGILKGRQPDLPAMILTAVLSCPCVCASAASA